MDTSLITGRPVGDKQRIWLLDAIRGVAIFGILWVNIFLRSDPIQLGALPQEHDGLKWLVFLSGTYKFRSMFAFLFGVGMAMQARRAGSSGSFVRTYLRRLTVLLFIGVMHFVFLWPGDILAFYAICGMLLVLLRHASVKTLLWLVFGFLTLSALQETVGFRLHDPALLKKDVASGYDIYTNGGFVAVTQRRIYDFVSFWMPSLYASFPRVMAMMVLGVLFERMSYLQRSAEHLDFWRKACLWGYLIGIPTNMLFAFWKVTSGASPAFGYAAKVAHTYGAPMLCVAYIATMVLMCRSGLGKRILKGLAPVGRMSLTAYLGHSVICSLLFYGYGLKWFGRVSSLHNVGLAFTICITQVVLANVWFRYLKMGPVEWIWRWATYGARPALRFDALAPTSSRIAPASEG